MSMALYYAAHFNVPNTHMDNNNISNATLTTYTLPSSEQTQNHSSQQAHTPSKRLPMASQKQSVFFLLPAELRNQIYDELLCANAPCPKQLLQYSQQRSHAAPQPIYPAILSTCKRIHQEAQDLLYTRHIFHAHPSLLTALPHLVSPLKPLVDAAAIAKITRWHLSLRLDTDPRFMEKQATAAFSGAEYVEIHVWQSMFNGCDEGVLRLFMGVRGVKIARVTGCAQAALAQWLEERMMRPLEVEVEMEEDKDERMQGATCACAKGVCGKCGKRLGCEVEGGMRWFGQSEGDAWSFGNR
jgi:hypothetical protein